MKYCRKSKCRFELILFSLYRKYFQFIVKTTTLTYSPWWLNFGMGIDKCWFTMFRNWTTYLGMRSAIEYILDLKFKKSEGTRWPHDRTDFHIIRPFVRGITGEQSSDVDSPHKSIVTWSFDASMRLNWTNCLTNGRCDGDLTQHDAHVMLP